LKRRPGLPGIRYSSHRFIMNRRSQRNTRTTRRVPHEATLTSPTVVLSCSTGTSAATSPEVALQTGSTASPSTSTALGGSRESNSWTSVSDFLFISEESIRTCIECRKEIGVNSSIKRSKMLFYCREAGSIRNVRLSGQGSPHLNETIILASHSIELRNLQVNSSVQDTCTTLGCRPGKPRNTVEIPGWGRSCPNDRSIIGATLRISRIRRSVIQGQGFLGHNSSTLLLVWTIMMGVLLSNPNYIIKSDFYRICDLTKR
jgi:hypothetical protein